MRRVLSIGMTVSLLASLSACSDSETEATSSTAAPTATTTVLVTTTSEAAPFHAVPDDSVVVNGTAACEFSEDGVSPDGEPGSFLVICELDMSDPRVSGIERDDRFHFFPTGPGGTLWLAEEAVIINESGTWRGSMQAAEDNEAIPSGEAHFVGEGAYKGLEFHYYFFHADLGDEAELRGWISGGG